MLRSQNVTRSFLSLAKRFANSHQMCSNKTTDCTEDSFELPPEPDNCCMSGCEKCVWIQYAKDLTDLYKDSGGTARKIIMEKIKDPTMQVFLRMELSAIKELKK